MNLPLRFCSRQLGKLDQRSPWLVLLGAICLTSGAVSRAQALPWPQRIANSAIQRWPDTKESTPKISNDQLGILLHGMNTVWYDTADSTYYRYAKRAVDERIAADTVMLTARAASGSEDNPAGSADNAALGQPLLLLYRVTQEASYYRAARLLDMHLAAQLRDDSPTGRDASLIALPFYAEYASVFNQPHDFAEITRQFISIEPRLHEQHDRAAYLMALVDTLPSYAKDNPGRATLLELFQRTAANIVAHQRQQDIRWRLHQEKGPSTCMFVYALQKGVRLGYLPLRDSRYAARVWQRVLQQSVSNGDTNAITDPSFIGALLFASTEMEMAPSSTLARGETVLVDAWFNSQQRRNAAGQEVTFHYKWNDYSYDGYSIFGQIFSSYGATLDTLYQAPTFQKLRGAQFYVIVSPDIPEKNPHPHYVQPEDAKQVAAWVQQGGVLVLMENDPANADIKHLDLIADRFGIHFNNALSHHIIGDQFAPGQIAVRGATPLFHDPHTLYMKDTCTLTLKPPATPLLTDATGVVMATARYGKGAVIAVVDPWLYNEYTDHRKLLPAQDNYAAGKEFVHWLLQQKRTDTPATQSR